MPAVSEPPPLPHRWRPLGVRLAGWFFGTLLVVVCAAMWVGLGAELRARFNPAEVGTMLGLVVALLVGLHALMRCRLDASQDGLTVVNGYRSRRLDWAQVVSVHLPPGAPWAVLDLVDGTTVSAMGIQGSDGQRARAAVQELRALLDRASPDEGAPGGA
jgi:hypothetical protein